MGLLFRVGFAVRTSDARPRSPETEKGVRMRKLFLITTILTCLLLFATASSAQTLPRGQYPAGTLKVTVPFDFLVSDVRLKASDYLFFIDTSSSMLHIRNVATGEQIMVFTRDIISNDRPTTDKLVFRQDGQQHVLHGVWSTQAGHVHDIVHGKAVKEL